MPRQKTPPAYLGDDDGVRFYRILWSIYAHAARAAGIADTRQPDDVGTLPLSTVLTVRNLVFGVPEKSAPNGAVAEVVATNPHALSGDDLAIAASWTDCRNEMCTFMRPLRSGAIVLRDESVYRVVGIMEPFDEMDTPQWPFVTQTTLLPFRDVITYDGILASYPIHIGGGMRRLFDDTYRRAKARGTIVTSFGAGDDIRAAPKPRRDWSSELDTVETAVKAMRASAGDPLGTGEAFSLLRSATEIARSIVDRNGTWEQCNKAIRRARRALDRIEIDAFSERSEE